MPLDVGYDRQNESRLLDVSVNRPWSRNLNRRRCLWRRSQAACAAYLESPCSRLGILNDDLSLVGTNHRILDRGRIDHSAWTGDAHPDEVSGSLFGNRVDCCKDVNEVAAGLYGERSRVY